MLIKYFLVDKQKEQEYQKFEKAWQEQIFPAFKENLIDYCGKQNGELVNLDFSRQIIGDIETHFQFFSPADKKYRFRIASRVERDGTTSTLCFDGDMINGRRINNLGELDRFIRSDVEHRYELQDGNGNLISVEDLLPFRTAMIA